MPTYNVTMKDDATEADLQAAKELAIAQGGTITNEFTLFKGFTVEYDKGTVTTLSSQEGVQAVELDQVVTIQ